MKEEGNRGRVLRPSERSDTQAFHPTHSPHALAQLRALCLELVGLVPQVIGATIQGVKVLAPCNSLWMSGGGGGMLVHP